jgi:hypothetical protein
MWQRSVSEPDRYEDQAKVSPALSVSPFAGSNRSQSNGDKRKPKRASMPTIAATFNEANSNAVCLARQLERYSKFETTHAMAA